MVIASVVIILLGITGGISIYSDITNEVNNTGKIHVDGSDFAELTSIFGSITASILSIICIAVSIAIVGVQWLIYGIVMLIRHICHK